MAADREPRDGRSGGEREPRSTEATEKLDIPARPDKVPSEIRDVSFPVAVRGYERRAVDEYVKRVNRVIADLEVGSSPHAAVRHALDRVGEQTTGVLQRAREAAEEITATARAEAEETTSSARAEAEQSLEEVKLQCHQLRGRSKEEAEQILATAQATAAERLRQAEEQASKLCEDADARLHALQSDTDAVWDARRQLLEDLPRVARELMDLAGAATARLHRPKGAGTSSDRPSEQQPLSELPQKSSPAPPEAEKAQTKRAPSRGAGVDSAKLQRTTERKSASVSSTRG